MESGVDFSFNEKAISFTMDDFLNVMAEFRITADEELLLLLIYHEQRNNAVQLLLKWLIDCGGGQMLEPTVKSLIDKNLITVNDITVFNPESIVLLPRFIEVMNKIELKKVEAK